MSPMKYSHPAEGTPVVKPVDPAALEASIARQRALMDEHRKERPGYHDILGLTTWAQAHSAMETHLDLLLSQLRAGWRAVPVPTVTPKQPPRLQVAPPPQLQQHRPAQVQVPTKETPVMKKSPTQALADGLEATAARFARLLKNPEDRALRQHIQTDRSHLRKLAAAHHLALPELPELPALPVALSKEGKIAPGGIRGPFPEASTKAGPDPYREPTAEDLRAAIADKDAVPAKLRVTVAPSPELSNELAQFLAEARAVLPPWVRLVQDELARARAKFPRADHLTLAMAEESGEVVKAMLDLRAGKGTLAELHAEIIQTMAMCVRLLEEGDPAVLGEAVA